MLKYNLDGTFVTYNSPEELKVELNLPLLDKPLDISSWADYITPEGNILVKPILPAQEEIIWSQPSQLIPQYAPRLAVQPTRLPTSSRSNNLFSSALSSKRESLRNIMSEVSQEQGFEELNNPTVLNLLLLQAERESLYTLKIKNPDPNSTALGFFLMTRSTRRGCIPEAADDNLFKNDPKLQVRAAYINYKAIMNTSRALRLRQLGYNDAQILALGWWLPDSLNMVLNGNFNYSLGGYSIRQALDTYLNYGR